MAKDKKTEKREKKQRSSEDNCDPPVSKKKKHIAEEVPEDPIEDLTPEERRVLERKLKKKRNKEEKRLKKEAESFTKESEEEPAKVSVDQLAKDYLKSWYRKNPEWKFQKLRQTWLLTNMYDTEKVSNKHFKRLLKYMAGLQGSARETTIQKAENYMKEYDQQETQDEADEPKLKRMRAVLQLLS
ncbi:protein cholesin isoform X2 [Engystomops pustulosus]|uniref:protein cholesin isoform X2 n=1 Tax=Engystomops pustulosus TaxID=76066 RepID=UPI003AFB52B7